MSTPSFTEALAAGPIVLDGGLATELEAQGHDLASSLWSARVLQQEPDAVVRAHRAYFDAGARLLPGRSGGCGRDRGPGRSVPASCDHGLSRTRAVRPPFTANSDLRVMSLTSSRATLDVWNPRSSSSCSSRCSASPSSASRPSSPTCWSYPSPGTTTPER